MNIISHLQDEYIDEAPTCSTCIYCHSDYDISQLDEEAEAWCPKLEKKVNQTDSICDEYIGE